MDDKTNGGVTIRVINGKNYYYFQWYENGKRRSKTITESEYLEYKNKKSYNSQNKDSISIGNISVIVGKQLEETINIVANYRKRECFNDILDYINSPYNSKVLILYGLRRTGKTSLIYQTILHLKKNDLSKCAYILIRTGATIEKLNVLLDDLYNRGYKYVFIDEITLIADFIDGAAFLSDIYANYMKIIISGTDSLGFLISSMNQLYDRCIMIHTSYISYKEFSYVLGINDIDKYIEYGGTMIKEGYDYHSKLSPVFYNEETTLNYIDASIVHNILHSLDCYSDGNNYSRLKELKSKNELAGIINRIIQDINHRFVSDVLNRSFKSNDYGSLKNLLRKNKTSDNLRTFLDRSIDDNEIYKDLMDRLDTEKDKYFVNEITLNELKQYLFKLEVISSVDVYDIDNNIKSKRIVFNQPGLRYSLAKSLLETLINNSKISSLSQNDLDLLLNTLLNDVKGRMLEDIVLLEMKKRNKYLSFQAEFQFGEIDMVLYDKLSNTCQIYEIKHSNEISKEQYRHLVDEEINNKIEVKYGEIIDRIVLYRGKNSTIDNIKYINIEEFLTK